MSGKHKQDMKINTGMSDDVINQLLEQGQALRQAMTRSLVEDETLLGGRLISRDVDIPGSMSDHETCQDIILDYLLGKYMTPSEETNALATLKNLPMLEEIIEALDINKQNTEQAAQNQLPRDDCLTPRSQAMSNANSLRLKICMLELSESGLRYLSRGPVSDIRQASPTFLLEYMPPRSYHGQQGQPVRLCSHKVIDRGVIFGQEKLHSCDSKKPITFNIYFRKLNHRTPVLLGCAEFEWNDLLTSEDLSCELNLPVRHTGKKEIVGRLKIKALLGQGNFLARKPVSQQQQQQQQRDTDSVSSSSKAIPRTIVSKSLTFPSEPSPIDCKSIPEFCSQSSKVDKEKAQLLQGLVHVTRSRGFNNESENLNLFLVLKAFWIEDELRSQIMWKCQNPCFNLHESIPVLLSPFFLERCRGNHAVLEVWDALETGNRMIGIAKLSLQTFYLAFQDNDVTQKLLSSKLPVVSVDHWVPVVNPISGAKSGELLVLLAFGSTDQVAQLECKRGLRNVASPHNISPQNSPQQSVSPAFSCNATEFQEGNKIHKLEMMINSITGFPLFQSLPNGEADCFVDWRLPVKTASGPAYKNFVSDLALCTLEPRFSSQHTHVLALPVYTSLASFVESCEKRGAIFRLWCRFYQPTPRDVIVAKAVLSPRAITKLEQEFNKKGENISYNMALPLTIIPCPETSKLCDNISGYLNIQLTYSSYSDSYIGTLSKHVAVGNQQNASTNNTQTSQTGFSPSSCASKVISTQTSIQMVDFAPENQEADEDCPKIYPSGLEQSKEKPENQINVVGTQTSLQLTDFAPESEESDEVCQILASSESENVKNSQETFEKSVNGVSTQTSLQLINYVPESEESDDDNYLPPLESEQTSEQTANPFLHYGQQQLSENTNYIPPQYHIQESLNNTQNEEIIPNIPIIQTDREAVVNMYAPSLENPQISRQTHNYAPNPQHLLFLDPANLSGAKPRGPMFRAHVEVERAVNLPVLEDSYLNTLVAPSTYITMPAEQPGMIVASPLVCKSCDPVWDWHCDIRLPVHLLMPGNQRLIMKLWFAISDERGQNPAADVVACFTTIGLQVLLSGIPQISGWFNLLDYAGHCQGQIKISITPLESLNSFMQMRDAVMLHQLRSASMANQSQQQQHIYQSFEPPPNPFTDLSVSALESKLKEQMADFDDLATQLKAKVAAMNIDFPPQKLAVRPRLVVQLASNSKPTIECENPELLFPPPGFINVPLTETVQADPAPAFPPPGYVITREPQDNHGASYAPVAHETEQVFQNPVPLYPHPGYLHGQESHNPNPSRSQAGYLTQQMPQPQGLLQLAYQPSGYATEQARQYPRLLRPPNSNENVAPQNLISYQVDIYASDQRQSHVTPNYQPEQIQQNHVLSYPPPSFSSQQVSHNPQSTGYPPEQVTQNSISSYPPPNFQHEQVLRNNTVSSYPPQANLVEQINLQPSQQSSEELTEQVPQNSSSPKTQKAPQNIETSYPFPGYLTEQVSQNPGPSHSSPSSLTVQRRQNLEPSQPGCQSISLIEPSSEQCVISVPDVNEISSSDSTDSDVTKLLANFDLETLHRLVEHLDDEVQKTGRCSKPDFVCEKKQTVVQTQTLSDIEEKETDESEILTPVSRQAPEGGNPTEKNSVSSSSSVSSKNQGMIDLTCDDK